MFNNSNNTFESENDEPKNKATILRLISIIEFIIFAYLLFISVTVLQNIQYALYVFLSIAIISITFLFFISFSDNRKLDRVSSIILTAYAWIINILLILISGGINSPFMLGFLFVIYLTYALLDYQIVWMSGITATLITSIILVIQLNNILDSLEVFGALLLDQNTSIIYFFILHIILILFFTFLLKTIENQRFQIIKQQKIALNNYQINNQNIVDNLVKSNEKLELIENKQNRASDYTKIIQSITRPINIGSDWLLIFDEILPSLEKITNAIHVGAYLLDDKKEWASLRLSSNELGQKLIKQNHRYHISTDKSVISAIQYRRIQRKRNIGLDSISFQDNPFLESNYEVVFPIFYQNQIFGALELQLSDETELTVFDETYIQQISTLIAMLIVYFDKNNKRNQSDNLQANQIIDKITSSTQKEYGYLYQTGQTKTVDSIHSHILKRTIETGQTIIENEDNNSTISVPIQIGDKTIAAFRCSKDKEKIWTNKEVQILESISQKLSVAITKAKIDEELQKHKTNEIISSTISSELRKTMDMENLLQNAVRQIGISLNANDVTIRLATDAENDFGLTQVEEEQQ